MSGAPATELEAAQGIRDGMLQSPMPYQNSTLFAMRITGTGVAYRSKLNEFVFRDPAIFLAPEFVARCNGLPVVWQHPKGDVLDSRSFGDSVVGTIVLPYVKGDEVWGIARILDAGAAQAMAENQLSTSPAVVFGDPGANQVMTSDDGTTLIREAAPALLDHLAICEAGVWDKGNSPTGVSTDGGDDDMTPEELKAAIEAAVAPLAERLNSLEGGGGEDDRRDRRDDRRYDRRDGRRHDRRHDAGIGGEAMDDDDARRRDDDRRDDEKVWSNISTGQIPPAIGDARKRFDADSRHRLGDHARRAMDKYCDDRRDDDDAGTRKARDDAARLLRDDDRRRRDDDDRRRHDDARRRRDAEYDRDPMRDLGDPRPTAADSEPALDVPETSPAANRRLREQMAQAQARADTLAAAFGERAPPPMAGEKLTAYRRRLMRPFQSHSKLYKTLDLGTLTTPELMAAAEETIYADAMHVATHQQDALAGTFVLREIKKRDQAGREITEFVGDPLAWMSAFMMPRRRVTKFLTGRHGTMQE